MEALQRPTKLQLHDFGARQHSMRHTLISLVLRRGQGIGHGRTSIHMGQSWDKTRQHMKRRSAARIMSLVMLTWVFMR